MLAATNPPYYLSLSRGHWGIENQLNWHLDVTFKEDVCRARKGNASLNLSTLRKFALQISSNQNDKLSLKKRQYKAALDIGYLKKKLSTFDTVALFHSNFICISKKNVLLLWANS
jgi:hypothetical protein